MNAGMRKTEEKPDQTQCPSQYCYIWAEKGSRLADGLYDNLEDALKDAAFVQDDLCGCTFGVCKRLDPINGDRDWYEPNEYKLTEAGLPWFYFISTPESVDIEMREEYIRDSERLWGTEHWRK